MSRKMICNHETAGTAFCPHCGEKLNDERGCAATLLAYLRNQHRKAVRLAEEREARTRHDGLGGTLTAAAKRTVAKWEGWIEVVERAAHR